MMHIAFITVGDTQRLTGGYLYHARVFAGLRADGVIVDEIVASGAALHEQMAMADQFVALFDPQRYDVLVIDALARGVVAPSVERWRAARPLVVLVHQLPSIAEAEPQQIAAEQALEAPLLAADRLIAVSTHGRDLLLARGVPNDRIAVVSPGFDRLGKPMSEYADSLRPHAARSSASDPRPPTPNPQSLRALCVAQWIPRKGITTLIAAWTRGRRSDAVLELIGETDADPAYTAQVQALIATAPSPSIVVRGTVTDAQLHDAYTRANLFVLPSRFEGYGMVYAEALAYGLPILATTLAPVQAIVGSDAGMFVSPDDPQALAAAIDRINGDPALWQHMATAAARRATALPRWNDTVRQFRQVLVDAARAYQR